MLETIPQLISLVDGYTEYLSGKGVRFNRLGFPLLDRSCYLDRWPERVVTYRERYSKLVTDPTATVLCLYCADERIYPRLERVLVEVPTYQRFMGVIGADVTVTSDMDVEWQEETVLLNQLFTAVLAANEVKVVANLRVGSAASLECLDTIPRGVLCASGTLGCNPTESQLDLSYSAKLMRVRPSGLLIYRRKDAIMEEQADILGIPRRRYPDAHALYRKLSRQGKSDATGNEDGIELPGADLSLSKPAPGFRARLAPSPMTASCQLVECPDRVLTPPTCSNAGGIPCESSTN